MLCIYSHSNDPFFNIASEEYLLKQFTDNIFLLYVNSPSVIVGKHQNTMAEIDYQYAKKNNIKIVRRLSGGGAVYHDLGNLNFCFIRNGKEGHLVDFRGFTKPIIDALGRLGLRATFEGHNSLMVDGLKFSGNAEHVYKHRVMHHGTILFSSNMTALAQVLYVKTDKYIDRAVKSVRANTVNISELIEKKMSVDEFAQFLMEHIIANSDQAKAFSFSSDDAIAINKLMEEKYTKWEWNFGYSPSYSFSRSVHYNNGTLATNVSIDKGSVKVLELSGNVLSKNDKLAIERAIIGTRHNPEELLKRIEQIGLGMNLSEKLFDLLF